MKYQGREQSKHVKDQRGKRPGTGMAVGGGAIIVLIIALLMGQDPTQLLQQMGDTGQTSDEPYISSEKEDQLMEFVGVVLKDNEDVWNELFPEQLGRNYVEPDLVVFTGGVQSACGMASSATGPFYCPGDDNVYLDLGFFDELSSRFGAPGDFAMAYVIAHEVGHHVQDLLGITAQVDQYRGKVSEKEYNALSVKLELQADFLAGVWAHHAQAMKNILDPGDIDEALRAANAIGDDRLQKQAQGYVVPDAFTHGTSEQRMRWFKKGYTTGLVSEGDTFNARVL
ncbi:MAG: neutral zinc metallopeptidase [Chitinophagales bacterium]|nr:neutral zinc metallopeptidase [Chitinophagales bacterium]HAE12750.1 metalloprotease [Bacteroidota bacterium]MCB9022709.1 neutral zinc metallopeptidase [Chitinophagales bacterium]HPE98176.1 neutral zinc metallopeptidase [Chitinophagales bacterium]HPR28940.1 neutral zinc metallopeptidase [Chitinophagales bacterium]